MNKQEFIVKLQDGLKGLPQDDIDEKINFYSEMIDDQIEEGISEVDAVKNIGNVEEIVFQIVDDTPLTKIVKNNLKPKRKLSALEIILICLGSPIWLSILISIISAIFSVYVSVWAIIISLWAVFIALVACGFGGIFAGAFFILNKNIYQGFALIGASIFCLGLSILTFMFCNLVSKGTITLTKKIVLGIKNHFLKKEDAQ